MDYQIQIGDCLTKLRELPDCSVNAVITDPPYCSGGYTETAKQQASKQGLASESPTLAKLGWFSNDNMTTGGLIWLLRQMMIECERVLTPNSSALVFADWRMVPHLAPALESSGLQYRNMIIWDKGNAGMGNGFKPRHECILHFVKGKATFYSKKGQNVLSSKRVHYTRKIHPTEKPVDLIEQLLEVVTEEGHTVLDPFMGSGSTGEACKNLNRKFIGIERSPGFAESAANRLNKKVD